MMSWVSVELCHVLVFDVLSRHLPWSSGMKFCRITPFVSESAQGAQRFNRHHFVGGKELLKDEDKK
jgi:hypothetical protein